MNVGIFINKQHNNFYAYASFLSSQCIDKNNIFLHTFDDKTIAKDIPSYDINIYLNRYAYINIEKIISEYVSTDVYLAYHSTIVNPSIVLAPKNKSLRRNISLIDCLYSLYSMDHCSLKNKSFLQNMGYVGTSISKAWFICFDDMSEYFIDSLRDLSSTKKAILYKNKIYNINIYKDFFIYKNTNVCKIQKNKYLIWNQAKQQWQGITLKKGNNQLC